MLTKDELKRTLDTILEGKTKEERPVVYLAGPYTGDVAEHKRQARLAASDLRRKGCTVIVPHLESDGCEDALDSVQWMQHGLDLLKRCDYIALFGNWTASKGSKIEFNNAEIWGIPLIAVYGKEGDVLYVFCGLEQAANDWSVQ